MRFQESDGFCGCDGRFHLLAVGFIQTLIPISFLRELDVSHCTLFSRCAYTPSSGVSGFYLLFFLIFYLVFMLHMVLQDMFDILLYPSVFLVFAFICTYVIITCNQLNSFLFK